MNILFLADPNSIHDIKWISFFSNNHKCFLVARQSHLKNWSAADHEIFFSKYNIKIIDQLNDFSIRNFFHTIREWRKLNSLMEKNNIQIFHILYAEPNALWCFFKNKNTEIFWLLTTRGTDILKTIPSHFNKKDLLNRTISWIYKRALNNFNKITCTSQLQQKGIDLIVSGSKTEIIRTGVDVENILSALTNTLPGNLMGKKYILFPRNMRPLYNHELSIGAIKLLTKSIKENYSFVFVDKDSTDSGYVKKIISLMEEDNIAKFIFLDRQPQESIWGLYKNASLVVMTPISDGSPVSAMEAMLCGTPVLVPNLPYDADIFNDTVFKLNSWHPHDLANLIENILLGYCKINIDNAICTIKEKGNRQLEMSKLDLIYSSAC